VTALLAALVPALALTPPADASTSASPLKVTISTLSPSTIPSSGPVTITGTITNRSKSDWTGLQVYMMTSGEPMTTSDELAAADATDPTAEVGSRLFSNGLYTTVKDLAPGQSTPYQLSVPRRDLGISGQPGVYWVGVHVLGANQDGRDGIADGRARTFMPLMTATSPQTSMSLVMPVEGRVVRAPDGSLADNRSWERSLAPDGRLDRLLGLSGTATQPFTWVVDPAVVDAATSVANGNKPLDTSATDGGSAPPPSPSPSPSGSASPSPSAGVTAIPQPKHPSTDQQDAVTWLKELQQQGSTHAVMAVPYGNLDVSAVLTSHFRHLFHDAVDLSSRTMAGAGIGSSSLVAPPSGYIAPRALRRIGPSEPVMLSDAAYPDASAPVLQASRAAGSGPSVVLNDTAASSGGPAPGPAFSALAVRQRLLSEAALHALSPDRNQPLVVSTPQYWNPGGSWQDSGFFAGLQVPWLTMIDLPGLLAASPGASTNGAAPEYPSEQRGAEVPHGNLLASHRLNRTGSVFAGLLARNSTVDEDLGKAAMLASSADVHSHPRSARVRAQDTNQLVEREMRKVRIEGPSFVTMSSESGTFAVTIINGLDESVRVGIRTRTDSKKMVIPSADPVTLGPGQRASVRMKATTGDIGVHSVTLVPVNADGKALGNVTRFNVRSSQVGLVIWVIMGVGGAVLLVMIVMRIVRRVSRRRKASAEPAREEEARSVST
jgi:hypothetical protein